jgi:hypothetical protein
MCGCWLSWRRLRLGAGLPGVWAGEGEALEGGSGGRVSCGHAACRSRQLSLPHWPTSA